MDPAQVARAAQVYLDANILIRMVESAPDDRAAIRSALAPHVEQGAVFITSQLSLAEVLVHPIRKKDSARIARYQRLLTDFVAAQPVSREVLLTAARLRAQTPALRTPDAIHLATALLAAAEVFLTGDRGIKSSPACPVMHV